MSNQQDSSTEIARRAFSYQRHALHAIHHAIGRARRVPRTRIHIVSTWPERSTWYECPRCGAPARLDSADKRCVLCRAPAVRREWVRPDIERADERARQRRAPATWVGTEPGRGPARYAEITDAYPWAPLPDGDYVIRRKTPRLPVNR